MDLAEIDAVIAFGTLPDWIHLRKITLAHPGVQADLRRRSELRTADHQDPKVVRRRAWRA